MGQILFSQKRLQYGSGILQGLLILKKIRIPLENKHDTRAGVREVKTGERYTHTTQKHQKHKGEYRVRFATLKIGYPPLPPALCYIRGATFANFRGGGILTIKVSSMSNPNLNCKAES